jgi:serine/threonine protein kinase
VDGAATPVPGQVFGNYRIVRLLGQGGMGAVYEAEDELSARRVALKVLRRGLGSRSARQRFLREGRLAASIHHPNSVYIYGADEIDGIPVISMELVAGGTL